MTMEDEYIRNYSFDPEFIVRKIESDRSEKERTKFSRRRNSDTSRESLSEEYYEEDSIEAEVHWFRSVKRVPWTN